MKKTAAGILAFLLLWISIPVGSTSVRIYAPDGRTAAVAEDEVEAYTAVGWYKTYEETRATLYALDGRQISVYKAEVPVYLSLGWYETYEETIATVYALDGRRMDVYKAEVPAYLSVGWYETYKETVEEMYAPDGRTITVYKAEVPAYIAVGWSTMPVAGPMVALTFDDGPHGVHTHSILNTLAQYGAKATFFVLGMQAAAYPGAVQRAHSMGCEIASHSYSHPDLAASSAWKVNNELSKTNAAVRTAIGVGPTLLRPPYGNHNATVRTAAGVPIILWNVDTLDWKSRNAQSVAQHVLNYASDGDIILMHDIYGSTAEAVKIIVPALQARGFRLVTVSEMAAAKGISLRSGTAYYGF